MKKSLSRLVMGFVMMIVVVSLACNLPVGKTVPTPTPETAMDLQATATNPPPAATEESVPEVEPLSLQPEEVYMDAFASYEMDAVKLPDVFVGGYDLPVDLTMVAGIENTNLSQAQLSLLSQNGFVVQSPVPGQYNEFYQVYESVRYLDEPVYVTSDAVFHVYHLIFDKMLRDLETSYFTEDLKTLSSTMVQASYNQFQALQGTELAEPARRNLAYFCVANQLLGSATSVPAEVADLVNQELALIQAHAGAQISPIWDREDLPEDKKLIEDYSQYVPRGHYTRSEELERYFRAMMWYGRMTLRLRDDFETYRALLMTHAMRTSTAADGTPLYKFWQDIYEPTVFIVGKSDDLSYHEYGAISDAVYGQEVEPTDFLDPVKFAQFVETAKQLPPPQVNSMWVWITEDKTEATHGFRLMGQRFTLDAYVFGQLMWRNVGTLDVPRDLPKGLDFFAAMGSAEALNILIDMGESDYENYLTQMEKVQNEVSTLQVDSWTQNLYWSWLYAFQPVIEPKDESYPQYMRTQAWTRKDLNTALGSWTELKHDTILYAKQVMAEMGGGGPPEPPHGYVEPVPMVYARLLALVQMTESGLFAREIMDEQTMMNLSNLKDLLIFLKDAAERELAGEELTVDDYWRIQYFGGELEALTLAAADKDEGYGFVLEDQKAALVADVATGINRVLEEAIGQPTRIYVILPFPPYQVGIGAVFTYYEFEVEPQNRLTDEQWQAILEAGTNPPMPEWTNSFTAE